MRIAPALVSAHAPRTSAARTGGPNDRATAERARVEAQRPASKPHASSSVQVDRGTTDFRHVTEAAERRVLADSTEPKGREPIERRALKALRSGAKDIVRSVRKEARDLLAGTEANDETRKSVRSSFKDFRTEVRSAIQAARNDRSVNIDAFRADVEAAFDTFVTNFRTALAGPAVSATPTDPAGTTEPTERAAVTAAPIEPKVTTEESRPAVTASIAGIETSAANPDNAVQAIDILNSGAPLTPQIAPPVLASELADPAVISTTPIEEPPRSEPSLSKLEDAFRKALTSLLERVQAFTRSLPGPSYERSPISAYHALGSQLTAAEHGRAPVNHLA